MVLVDIERCMGCGVCETVCPAGVFKLVNGKCSVTSADCIGCRNCESSCPAGCITAGEAVEI